MAQISDLAQEPRHKIHGINPPCPPLLKGGINVGAAPRGRPTQTKENTNDK